MKHTVIGIALVLALTAPAFAQGDTINTNTNTITIGKPPPAKASHPPKATVPAKPAKTEAPAVVKPATRANGPVANGGSGGSAQVSTSSNSTGGAGGEGGVGGTATASGGRGGAGGEGGRATAAGGSASGGTVNVNNAHQRSAASPTAPAIYSNAECANAASGAVTTGVFGFAFGATSDNTACNARQDFSILSANDLPNAAAASMCLGSRAQRVAIEAEGVDCEILTKGEVKTAKAGAFDMEAYCQEPVGDWERAADRLKVCANAR